MIPSTPYLLQYIVSGVTLGSIYGMIALGFTLIHNATGVVNFAQGEFVTYGALIAISCSAGLGLPMPLAVLIAVAAVTLLGALLEWAAIRPARGSTVITLIIITVGASILLRGVAMWLWGPDALPMRHFSGETPMQIGQAAILPQHVWIMGIVLVTMFLLWVLGERTQVGKAMRACAMDTEAAQLVGIPASRMIMLSFAL
ncbi:MAG: branched-chain amino acid ABC transporter permease, partial [Armatimonadetes bacterium]|nr:branched-chain amino acid ABC transporter permease [Armatimonadota bacterium]